MTRAEKVARAQRLRAQGLTIVQIAERMGVARSTAGTWLADPDLSKQWARREGYRGVCDWCGGPTDGSNGAAKAPSACASCLEWSDDRIIAAIRAWADAHDGVPPTKADWLHASLDHPCSHVVCRRIGWNEALLRAGCWLHMDKRPETQEWIEQQLRAGVPVREIADELGVTLSAIHRRMRWRGMRVSDLRKAAA